MQRWTSVGVCTLIGSAAWLLGANTGSQHSRLPLTSLYLLPGH
jgi:hypothetical protein